MEMTHQFSVVSHVKDVDREIQIARSEDETFLVRLITQWKDEPTPVISELHLTDVSLILLNVAVNEATNNLEDHKVKK